MVKIVFKIVTDDEPDTTAKGFDETVIFDDCLEHDDKYIEKVRKYLADFYEVCVGDVWTQEEWVSMLKYWEKQGCF